MGLVWKMGVRIFMASAPRGKSSSQGSYNERRAVKLEESLFIKAESQSPGSTSLQSSLIVASNRLAYAPVFESGRYTRPCPLRPLRPVQGERVEAPDWLAHVAVPQETTYLEKTTRQRVDRATTSVTGYRAARA